MERYDEDLHCILWMFMGGINLCHSPVTRCCVYLPARLGAGGDTFRVSFWPFPQGYLTPHRPWNQCGTLCQLPSVSIPIIHLCVQHCCVVHEATMHIYYLGCASGHSNGSGGRWGWWGEHDDNVGLWVLTLILTLSMSLKCLGIPLSPVYHSKWLYVSLAQGLGES